MEFPLAKKMSRAEQSRAEQSRAEQSRAEQSRADSCSFCSDVFSETVRDVLSLFCVVRCYQ